MVRDATLQTAPWHGIGLDAVDVAAFFYERPGWEAFGNAQECAEKNNGMVDSLPGILEERTRTWYSAGAADPAWRWLTANSEEDIGVDIEGRIGKKGEPVMIVSHGGGIMLSSPERLRKAYLNRTPSGEPAVRPNEISMMLAGRLPSGQDIKIYTFKELMAADSRQLPQIYAIATPLKNLKTSQSALVPIEELLKNELFMMRAGHPHTVVDYVERLQKEGTANYGNWHTIQNANPATPSGRVLQVRHGRLGLDGDGNLQGYARFVAVSPSGFMNATPKTAARIIHILEDVIEPSAIQEAKRRLERAGYR